MTSPAGGNRVDYFKQTVTGTFSAAGVATCVLPVPVGQWLFPTFMKVATQSQVAPFATCTVYEGSPGITDATTYVDDTLFGNQDTSSIISGTVIQYGEVYTAVFAGGKPNDTALLTVYGVVTNVPLNAGQLIPSSPGLQFKGHAIQTTNQLLSATQNLVLPPNGGGFTAVIDVRAYASYFIEWSATTVGNGTPGAYEPVKIDLKWFGDIAATVPSQIQSYTIYSDNTTNIGGFVSNGTIFMEDVHHGQFLQIFLSNQSTTQIVTITLNVFGTSRVMPNALVRSSGGISWSLPTINNQSPESDLLGWLQAFVLAAAGSLQMIVSPTLGPIQLTFRNGTGILNVFLSHAGRIYNNYSVAAATVDTRLWYPTREQLQVGVTSTPGTTFTFTATNANNK